MVESTEGGKTSLRGSARVSPKAPRPRPAAPNRRRQEGGWVIRRFGGSMAVHDRSPTRWYHRQSSSRSVSAQVGCQTKRWRRLVGGPARAVDTAALTWDTRRVDDYTGRSAGHRYGGRALGLRRRANGVRGGVIKTYKDTRRPDGGAYYRYRDEQAHGRRAASRHHHARSPDRPPTSRSRSLATSQRNTKWLLPNRCPILGGYQKAVPR